ncbi:metallophosphoesterase [Eisenbergiella porci]|uniref:metallophosphoesterase n=1 Tax=Eisenbergiella porci TaxID=2652274 RepID=UPI002A7F7494|nr:metallophosphoesterase [Eisenbergiella porci]
MKSHEAVTFENKLLRIIKMLIRILFCCIVVSAGMIGYARFIEPELLIIKPLTVETDDNISPCRIIFFSDLHLGKYYDETHLDRIVNEINGLNADFVIFGGDLFDNYARDYESLDFEYIRKKLSEIRVAVSKYAVWGKHDYGGGGGIGNAGRKERVPVGPAERRNGLSADRTHRGRTGKSADYRALPCTGAPADG